MVIINRFLKGSIIGILLMAVMLVTPGMVYAMQFSEPVLIGEVGLNKGGNFYTSQALPSSVTGSYYDFRGSKDIIRLWWNLKRVGSSSDNQNTVAIEHLSSSNIREISGSNGISVYFWSTAKGMYDGNDFVIFGPNRQGKFVKYIDRKRCDEVSNGAVKNYACGVLSVQNDTFIIKCYSGSGSPASGRFILKWDEKAQWFGIAFEKM